MGVVLGFHGGTRLNQHEPSACLMVDGRIVALCEEERYNRQKGSYGLLPEKSIRACLKIGKISWGDIDLVVSPGATYGPEHRTRMVAWMEHSFGPVKRYERVHHHDAHCAAALYGSGFDPGTTRAVSLDSSGDGISGRVWNVEDISKENSLGAFYTAITHWLGFADGDEYKVMGLAPFGKPNIDLGAVLRVYGGGWELAPGYIRTDTESPFEPCYTQKLVDLLGPPRRGVVTQYHMDVAHSAQAMLETALMRLFSGVPFGYGLALAGGVALNCAANGKLFQYGAAERIYVSPVASDRGLSLGCAYLGAKGDKPDYLKMPYLGQEYTQDEIRRELDANGCSYGPIANPPAVAANYIKQGKIIGWFQGRSEAGARALGNRSVLASCEHPGMKDRVNATIKYRDRFRPFAPAVLAEEAENYFHTAGREFPTMSFALKNTKPGTLAETTHVDGTCRVQTVRHIDNPLFHDLILECAARGEPPAVLNTSFNLNGQPIVESPRDALMTFYGSGMDALFIGDFLVKK